MPVRAARAAISPEEQFRLRHAVAEILEMRGDDSRALGEYLRASGLAHTAASRNVVIRAVARLLSACRPGDGEEERRPQWDEIEEMLRALQEGVDPALLCRRELA